MRLMLALLVVVFAVPAQAANECIVTPVTCRCVTTVFHRPWRTSPDDLQIVTVRWANVANLNNRKIARANNQEKKVAVVWIFFNANGGLFSGVTNMEKTRMGLKYVPPTQAEPRETLYWGLWALGPTRTTDQGSKNWTIAALDENEGETAPFENQSGNLSSSTLHGTDVVLEGVQSATVASAGQALFPEVDADLQANGC